jgi:hypothetical protein
MTDDLLRSSAFTGAKAAVGEWDPSGNWGLTTTPPARSRALADFDEPIDPKNWKDPRVGYGVILPMDLPGPLPDSVTELTSKREAPILRYDPRNPGYLTNLDVDKDFSIAQSAIGGDRIPQYLLIIGGPDKIPWSLQFELGSRRFVGRLPLSGAHLDNYISHLLNGWENPGCNLNSPVVWSTDYGYPDITELMHKVIAQPVHNKYASNSRILDNATLLEASAATRLALRDTLVKKKPGLIVWTSHGLISPLAQPDQIGARIGALVDQNQQILDSAELVASWSPDGAIWYAHACCSAGTAGARQFQNGLVKEDTELALTFRALEKAGPCVAPLPLRLLCAEKPARGFIGHVEPTFDITIRDPASGELFTKPVIDALYTQLLQQNPVGYALQFILGPVPSVHSAYLTATSNFDGSAAARARLRDFSLRGADLEGTVLLGDPTAVMPKLT